MKKIGVFLLLALLLVLSACGSSTIEGKLNKEGGFILAKDHSLEVLDFNVKDGKGTVDIKRYFIRYYFDEDEINESVEQYKVSVDDELRVFNGFGGTEVYTYANQKEIDKMLKELE